MNKSRFILSLSFIISLLLGTSILLRAPAYAQKIETVDGVRVVHNKKGGEWGSNPRISINLIRTIGDINTPDENLAFNGPGDIAVDDAGNLYILDSRNHRLQKFNPEAKYLATFGRRGQGPAEFNFPQSVDLDDKGMIYVLDGYQKRILVLTPEGKDQKTILMPKLNLDRLRRLKSGLLVAKGYLMLGPPGEKKPKAMPKLARILDLEGNTVLEFGDLFDFGEGMTTSLGNSIQLDVDGQDNILLTFFFQNRIEKYSPDGRLLWRADRDLNFTTEVLEKGKVERTGGGISMSSPRMNQVSAAIAADDKGRVWVATLIRQLKKEEQVYTIVAGGSGGITTMKTEGNVDLQTTDMYKLEIFSTDGLLLGDIPLTHFVDEMFICKDRLFVIDRERGAKFYEYQIIEKQ